jgi:hypothetical protein
MAGMVFTNLKLTEIFARDAATHFYNYMNPEISTTGCSFFKHSSPFSKFNIT